MRLFLVLGITAVLSLAYLRWYDDHVEKRENALKATLLNMRQAIEDFEADNRRLATSLDEVARAGYVRKIPADPITRETDTWIEVNNEAGYLVDVRSGASGKARDGTEYSSW